MGNKERRGGKREQGLRGQKRRRNKIKNLLEKKGTERAQRRERGARQRGGGADKGRQRKGGGGSSKRNKL